MSIELNLSTTLTELECLPSSMAELREQIAKRKSEVLARLDEFERETDALAELARNALERHAVALEALKEGDPIPEIDRNRQLYHIQIVMASKLMETRSYQSLFEEACEFGDTEFVELLLAKPSVDPAANSSLALVRSLNFPDVVKLLLEDGRANPVECKDELLRCDSFISSSKLFLIDGRLDPFVLNYAHYVDMWGLKAALLLGDADRLKVLLTDYRVPKLARLRGTCLIEFAVEHATPELLKILLDDGRFNDARVFGETIAFEAMRKNKIENLRCLLDHGDFFRHSVKGIVRLLIQTARLEIETDHEIFGILQQYLN
jgi:hypothetical protein